MTEDEGLGDKENTGNPYTTLPGLNALPRLGEIFDHTGIPVGRDQEVRTMTCAQIWEIGDMFKVGLAALPDQSSMWWFYFNCYSMV